MAKKLTMAPQLTEPPPGNSKNLKKWRLDYIRAAGPIGTVPLPGTLKGVLKTLIKKLSAGAPEILIDKLAERLAFERSGTRLYELLIAKCEVVASGNKDLLRALKKIHREEAEHMAIVKLALEDLGADPTAVTPCANTTAVMSMGLFQVVADPRTSIAQCLEAALVAELVDNDSWEFLIELSELVGLKQTESFQLALKQERQHLSYIRAHLKALTFPTVGRLEKIA
jgi:rubrerythrin